VKTLKNHCFYCGLETLGRPRSDVWRIKTAIVAQTPHRTPKNGENVSPVVPKVAQRSQNGARGGGHDVTFSIIFPKCPSSGPLGTPGGSRGAFFDGFWSILVDLGVIFSAFSSQFALFPWIDRSAFRSKFVNRSIAPSMERFQKSIHQSTNQSINPSINQSINRSINRYIKPSFHQSIDRQEVTRPRG